jgi:hypothetical protein
MQKSARWAARIKALGKKGREMGGRTRKIELPTLAFSVGGHHDWVLPCVQRALGAHKKIHKGLRLPQAEPNPDPDERCFARGLIAGPQAAQGGSVPEMRRKSCALQHFFPGPGSIRFFRGPTFRVDAS